ncbi:MAG: acyl-CoA dehydratase activase [Oscillospiraceae bacterium]|jgi:predicted CoA-substrate-specific enzyme activase|nr:acyl-CoA dehydratase activase [Oscillospiraceae bacterium]
MNYTLGIDVGSTTVKTVMLDGDKNIVYSEYERHYSKVQETAAAQIEKLAEKYPDIRVKAAVTGSAGLGLSGSAQLPFVQEVYAATVAVKEDYPDADSVVELGGEDAKIIFLTGGLEQRMNGSCAGGTGAFIDQMATLWGISTPEMDKLSLNAKKTYPIASRCGVFAKSDIQPLLNQGAAREDIAASIFQAVVDQTVSGLAQGRTIEGKVLFLGGPLSFLQGLRKAFKTTLNLEEGAVFPDNAPVFMAYGSALFAANSEDVFTLEEVAYKIKHAKMAGITTTGERLFESHQAYEEFISRHQKNDLNYADIRTYKGDAYLGIDAGSTTTKMVLITEKGDLLYKYYAPNKGEPLDRITDKLRELYAVKNEGTVIKGSAVTGYGEELLKAGLSVDCGVVETVAHFKAAAYFKNDVDFIIDIGGQDIKCFKIKMGAIDSIMLNEACSSGCGSFIQTFAEALGYNIEEFSKLGLFAKNPVDLGSRCTVFMNSSVKQAQKDGASVEDISAGLSMSVIKNAVYKVIRAHSADELGKNIVVQGGTFLNDAILRSFEMELGRNVIRPSISGLMGAFGAALYAKEKAEHNSRETRTGLITPEELEHFSYKSETAHCKGCTANCTLNIITFSNGRKFISGNRCERGAGIKTPSGPLCMYEYKREKLNAMRQSKVVKAKAKVGLPLVLNFYELMPFWKTFFEELGFQTVISDESTRETFDTGLHTSTSDTVGYPAQVLHGHIEDLLEKGADFIFYPCMTFNIDDSSGVNHYNCPLVAYYPELIAANNPKLNADNFLYPYLDLNSKENAASVMRKTLCKYNLQSGKISAALTKSYAALDEFMKDIANQGEEVIAKARAQGKNIILLCGRPYHADAEINHGINKLITGLGMAVIAEDSLVHLGKAENLGILNQWTYHARIFNAVEYALTQPDIYVIQLVSFGCGIDSIIGDEVMERLERSGRLYTQLKIDEINNLGAAKIRIRSLMAAMGDK